mgnify:CR=1 FL=1
MKEKLIALLTFTSSLKSFGMKFIRVAILVVFVWIGGLKYFHYEADGIVPFVANSPFMSFFYAKGAPEYKEHKNAEGAFVPENRAWHEANRTYTFSYGLGALIMSIGILVFLVILGVMVCLMNKAGGSAAFGRWAAKNIKSRAGAQLATIALGILIFIDDYFNCLTVGSVMRPVTGCGNASVISETFSPRSFFGMRIFST